jgi:hypothetical protein
MNANTNDGGTDAIEQLRDHPWVFDLRDVSMDGTTTFTVQFGTVSLPQQLLESDEIEVREVWVGALPQRPLRWVLPNNWLIRKGIGHSCIAARVELSGSNAEADE